jgi:hypothetical protein
VRYSTVDWPPLCVDFNVPINWAAADEGFCAKEGDLNPDSLCGANPIQSALPKISISYSIQGVCPQRVTRSVPSRDSIACAVLSVTRGKTYGVGITAIASFDITL